MAKQIIKIVGYINSYRLKNQHLLPPDTTAVVVNETSTSPSTSTSSSTPNTGITASTTTATATATATSTTNHGSNQMNLCPFENVQSSPCTSSNCYGVNWLDINNVSSSCKDDVNTYCKTTGKSDKTCVYLKNVKNQYRKTQQTCQSSKLILNELKSKTPAPIRSETPTPNPTPTATPISTETNEANEIKIDKNGNYVDENGEKIDLSLYVRKDKIPCWGCKL